MRTYGSIALGLRCQSRSKRPAALAMVAAFACLAVLGPREASDLRAEPVKGWLHWRGPSQDGSSDETNLPGRLSPVRKSTLWTYPISGGGTPVIAGERVYVFGYDGEGADLQEVLLALDARTGKKIWERRFSDFLSDIIYNRYAIGSPAIDPETGNVYLQTSAGLLVGFDRNGNSLWERSMMEELGRLTFPNGRTGGPAIEGSLVIVHAITANWGSNGPARDRFYAFDKENGELVWYSQPGVPPKDSSFSPLRFDTLGDRRVFFAGTGCGNIVCLEARTGKPLFRYQLSRGGVNSAVLRWKKNTLVAIHGKENLDSSTIGRMVALNIPESLPEEMDNQMLLGRGSEIWRNNLEAFTSSPILHGDHAYQIVRTGELHCIDLNTGGDVWKLKLAPDQLHASPLYADGKIYAPMLDGRLVVIRAGKNGGQILSEAQLEGACLGAPSAFGGRLYVLTKKKLYCFGKGRKTSLSRKEKRRRKAESKQARSESPIKPESEAMIASGVQADERRSPHRLQIVPAEFALNQGESLKFRAWSMDAAGNRLSPVGDLRWGEVAAPLGDFGPDNRLAVKEDAPASTLKLSCRKNALLGSTRGRILPRIPFADDFESYSLDQRSKTGVAFSYPPPPWMGARVRWQILEQGENQVLANTLDRILFQRSMTFIGLPELRNYILQADVMSDGNRRVMSNVGLINQRYNISLIGNWQILEVVSNHERLKVSVPYKWRSNVWYTLKTQVDVLPDGSGVVRAKVWPRENSEPTEWTIEVPHRNAHKKGAPGLYGFSPQSLKKVYLDNLSLTENTALRSERKEE